MRALLLGMILDSDAWLEERRGVRKPIETALLGKTREELEELNAKIGQLREPLLELGTEYRGLELRRLSGGSVNAESEGKRGLRIARIDRLNSEIASSRKELDGLRKERR